MTLYSAASAPSWDSGQISKDNKILIENLRKIEWVAKKVLKEFPAKYSGIWVNFIIFSSNSRDF